MKIRSFFIWINVYWFCFLVQGQQENPYCEEITTAYTLSEITPLGLSGSDLLALAQRQAITISYGYKSTTTQAVIEATPVIPTLNYVESHAVYPPCGENEDCSDRDIICTSRMNIEVVVSLVSEDGAFQESLPMTLSFPSSYGSYLDEYQYAEINLSLAPSDIRGDFYRDAPLPAPYWFFTGQFSAHGFLGSMTYWTKDCNPVTTVCRYDKIWGATFDTVAN